MAETLGKKRRAPLDQTFGDEGKPLSKRDRDIVRRTAAARDAPMQDAYEAGLKEGRSTAKPRSRPRNAKRTTTKARSTAKRVTREGRAPTNLTGVLFGTVLLLVLYNALRGAEQLAGFLGGIQRAIAWLSDPTAIVLDHKEQP